MDSIWVDRRNDLFILAGDDRNEKDGKRVNKEDRSGPSL